MKLAQQCISTLQHDSNADITHILQSPFSSREPTYYSDPSINSDWTEPNEEHPFSWKGSLRHDLSKQSLKNPPTTAELSNTSIYPPLSGKVNAKSSRSAQSDKKTITCNHNCLSHPLISTAPSVLSNIISSASHNPSRSGAVRQLFTSSYITTSVSGTRMSTNVSTKPINSLSKSSDAIVKSTSAPRISTSNNSKPVVTVSQSTEKLNKSTSSSHSYVKASSSTTSAVLGSTLSTSNVNIAESSSDQTQNIIDQIMKTPSIFQEAASQITQPKKYSDAVGKKQVSDTNGHPRTSSYSSVLPPTNSGGSKINLAPGSRPVGCEQSIRVIIYCTCVCMYICMYVCMY